MKQRSGQIGKAGAAIAATIVYLSKLVDPLAKLGVTTLVGRVLVVAGVAACVHAYQLFSRHSRLGELLVEGKRKPLGEAEPAALGVVTSPLARQLAGKNSVAYVDRNTDPELSRKMREVRVVIVVGPSGSGKSTSALEQAKAVAASMKVLAPRKPSTELDRPLSELLEIVSRRSLRGRPAWLWLDNLGLHLERESVDVSLVRRWLDRNPKRRVVVTISSKDQERFLTDPSSSGQAARELQELGVEHELDLEWEPEEQARAKESYPLAGDSARRLSFYLSAGTTQLRRFRNAREACPEAEAILQAAADWRRARMVRPVPATWLRLAFVCYLDRLSAHDDLDARFASGLEWATDVAGGRRSVLEPDSTLHECFVVADVVVEQVERRERPIPRRVWELLLDTAADPNDFVAVADAALAFGQLDVARRGLEDALEDVSASPALHAAARESWTNLVSPRDQTIESVSARVIGELSPAPSPMPRTSPDLDSLPQTSGNRGLAYLYGRPGLLGVLRVGLLLTFDVLGLWASVMAGYLITQLTLAPDLGAAQRATDQRIAYVALLVVVLFAQAGMYRDQNRRGNVARIFAALTEAAIVFAVLRLLVGPRVGSFTLIACAFVISCVVVGSLRGAFTRIAAWAARSARGRPRRMALVGDAGEVARVLSVGQSDRLVVGQVIGPHDTTDPSLDCLGYVDQLEDIVRLYRIDEVVVCQDQMSDLAATELAASAWQGGARLRALTTTRHFLVPVNRYVPGHSLPLEELRVPELDVGQRTVKRCFDLGVAVPALVFLSPLMLLIAAAIKTSRGPAIQQMSQPGLDGEPFPVFKFRVTYKGSSGGRPVYTPPGKVINRFGLDELPQLLNVVRGEMSLVGPRPISAQDFDRLPAWQKRRYLVPPGVTGLWQISGRDDRDSADMVRLDLYYVQRWSLFLDVEILIKTFGATLRGRRATLSLSPDGVRAVPSVERRAPFAAALLELLPTPTGLAISDALRIAREREGDVGQALRWMVRMERNGWLEFVEAGRAGDGEASRMRLSVVGREHLAVERRFAVNRG